MRRRLHWYVRRAFGKDDYTTTILLSANPSQIASGPSVLEDTPASVQKYTLKALENLKVDVKLQTKVTGSVQLPDGRQELTLSTGAKLTADMYVPTFGLTPNSSYIPTTYLNAHGSVMVDEFLRVRGVRDVWAIGDVSDVESWQFITCDRQSTHLAKNMISMMNNKPPLPYKIAASRMSTLLSWLTRISKLIFAVGFMGLQIGKKQATGHFGNFKVPTFIIVRARKNLFIDNMGPTVTGTLF